MRCLTALVLAMGLLAAPAVQAASNATPATFQNACAPNDEPALKITIPAGNDRTLEIRVWGASLETMARGKLYSMTTRGTPSAQSGQDLFFCGQFGCDRASGQFRVGTYKPGEMLDGELIWHNEETGATPIPFVAQYVLVPSPCE